MSEQILRVYFLTQDLAFVDPLARALGPAFAIKGSSDLHPEQTREIRTQCDAVMLDLRSASTRGNHESALRLIDEIGNVPRLLHLLPFVMKEIGKSFWMLSSAASTIPSPIPPT